MQTNRHMYELSVASAHQHTSNNQQVPVPGQCPECPAGPAAPAGRPTAAAAPTSPGSTVKARSRVQRINDHGPQAGGYPSWASQFQL